MSKLPRLSKLPEVSALPILSKLPNVQKLLKCYRLPILPIAEIVKNDEIAEFADITDFIGNW